jgi:hypothetical protein
MNLLSLLPPVAAAKKYAMTVAIVLALLAIASTVAYVDYLRDELAQAKREVTELTVTGNLAASANESNVSTISELRRANRELAEAATASAQETAAALLLVERARQDASHARHEAGLLAEERNARPECDKALSLDLGVACPLLRERLQQHSKKSARQD